MFHFVGEHIDCSNKYSEGDHDIFKMIDFLIDNMFVEFWVRFCKQAVDIPISTNCAPLLANLFLYSYEAEIIHGK